MNDDDDDACGTMNINRLVFMSGYLPGALPERSHILSPLAVKLPSHIVAGKSWKDVCGGGCGFALAITDCGRLITWGSTDDLGQCYATSGKQAETLEPFPLPIEASVVHAAAGWAHCVSVTDGGEVYTWGWKECIPSGKMLENSLDGDDGEISGRGPVSSVTEDAGYSFREPMGALDTDGKCQGESVKRQKISTEKTSEVSVPVDENAASPPCLVSLNPGVRIVSVAAGGRHTLVLSDKREVNHGPKRILGTKRSIHKAADHCPLLIFTRVALPLGVEPRPAAITTVDLGKVWGWGYGGEGQLGQGSRIGVVSSPRLIPCVESSYHGNGDQRNIIPEGGMCSRVPGKCVKSIACGGRHSVVLTDAGAMLTFGWGLYGQCGHGSTDDEHSPACVTSLLGVRMEGISAGLWHTLCVSTDGDVYAFGGNQFGQLGTGVNQAETLPKLLDAPCLENENVERVSCGARHSAAITGDGDVFCWGWNKYGQLGLGDTVDRNSPSLVKINGFALRNVSCGWWHTLLLAHPCA